MHHHFHEYLIFSVLLSHAYDCTFSLFSMIIDEVSLFSTLMFSMMSLLCFIVVFYDFISNIMDACGVGLSSRFGSSRKVVSGCFMIFSMSMAVMLLTFSVFLLVTSNSYRLFWGHMLAIFFLVSLYCLHAILFTFVYSNPPWAQTSTLGSQ